MLLFSNMGMMSPHVKRDIDIIPEFEINSARLIQERLFPGDAIAFSGFCGDYCIGIVDIMNSTKIAATLSSSQFSKYYSVFLNTMSFTARRFGAIVVKNIGDGLLYYFPNTSDPKNEYEFMRCIDCSLAMIGMHDDINARLYAEKMPTLNYRVSADYGKIMMAKSSSSSYEDIFGLPVNMCAKINTKAMPNSVVIGGDLHQIVKGIGDYRFIPGKGCSIGLKYQYPIYTVYRKKVEEDFEHRKWQDTIESFFDSKGIKAVKEDENTVRFEKET